jgi:hypothetical protein
VPKSRIRGSIPPLPNKPSWRGAKLKHEDNFAFNSHVSCWKLEVAVKLEIIIEIQSKTTNSIFTAVQTSNFAKEQLLTTSVSTCQYPCSILETDSSFTRPEPPKRQGHRTKCFIWHTKGKFFKFCRSSTSVRKNLNFSEDKFIPVF